MRVLHALGLLLLLATPLAATEVRISDRVFLIRDKPGATTRFEMIVNAGSNDEAGGDVRGIAHYVEHLVLVGRNPEHKDLAIRFFADGSSNGWTNDKATAYLHNIPSRATGPAADLEKLFSFYAARLSGFSVSEADAARERNVVLQEHDWRVQSSPSSLFYRDLSRKLIPDHPAGIWTIGTRDSIRAITLDEAKAFHQTWYAPNNAWFVVRGDIAPEALKAIADKALAGLPPKILPPRLGDKRPAITVERIDERRTDPQVSRTTVSAAKLVRLENGDAPARRAARALLGNFMASQFTGSAYDQLVEEKKLAAEGINVFVRRAAPDTFIVSANATLADGADPLALREALVTYLDTIGTSGSPPQGVVDRLKKRIAESRLRLEKNPTQVHSRLVGWLADGLPYADLKAWPGQVAETPLSEIAAVAKALSAPGRVVTGILEAPGAKP